MVGRWDFVELIGLSLFYLFRLGWIRGSSFVRLRSRKFDLAKASVDGGSDVITVWSCIAALSSKCVIRKGHLEAMTPFHSNIWRDDMSGTPLWAQVTVSPAGYITPLRLDYVLATLGNGIIDCLTGIL